MNVLLRGLLLVGLLVECHYSQAQTVVVAGQIREQKTQQSVEGASVLLCRSVDSTVVAFAHSDKTGTFTIDFTPEGQQVYMIRVTHISYRESIRMLPPTLRSLPFLTIELAMGQLVLNEVQVSAHIPVREQGDSTRYKIDAFRNGSEQSLEDVLRKMPNIRVEDNGDVFFKNRKVEKVMLDGDDLIGAAYQLATRSINPAVLNEVQAIEHFSENKLLRRIEASDKTVLNLTVKNTQQKVLFGSLSANVGPQRYNGVGNLFSYSKRIKAFAVLSGNNTGVRRLDLTDANATVLPDERPITDLMIRPFAQTAQPFPRNLNSPLENLNNEQVSTFNVALNPTNALKITANLSLLRDRVQAGRLQIYQLIGDAPVSYQQADTLRQQPTLAHLKLQLNYDLSARTSLLYRGVMAARTVDLQQTTQFITAGQAERFPQQFTNRLADTWQLLELTRKLNDRQALVFSGQFIRTHLSEQYTARLNPVLWAAVFNDSLADGRTFRQQTDQTNQLVTLQARWLYGTKTRKLEQQVGFQQNRFDGLLHQQQADTDLPAQPVYLDRQTLYSRTSGKLVWPKFELNGHLQLGRVWAAFMNQTVNRSPVQANLTASYKVSRLSQVVLSYDRQETPVLNTSLIASPVIIDFRSAQQGVQGLLFDVKNQVSLTYLLTDIAYRKMTLLASLFASRSTSFWNFADLTFTPDYTIARLINTPNVYTLGGVGSLEKLIYPLSGNIRLQTNVIANQSRQQLNGVPRTISTFIPTVTLKYISAFQSAFNLDLGVTYTHTQVSVLQAEQHFYQQFTTWIGHAQLLFRRKVYQLSATAEANRIQQNDYLFLKASANWIITPKLSLRLDGMNLLNQTTYRQVAITPTVYSTGVFPLLPRMVLAGVRYSF